MKNILFILLIIVGCKSKQYTNETKIDLSKIKVDKTITNSESFKVDFSLDEMIIDIYNPKEETTITDNKGNIKTFKNVKTITTKKQNKSVKKDDEMVNNDITTNIKDKSTISTKEVIESDTKQYKSIFISIAFIVGFILVGYLVFKFK